MDQNHRGFNIINQEYQSTQALPVTKTFIANVFLWMTLALAVTAVTAYWFASTPALIGSLINILPDGRSGGFSILGWIVMLAPLGFVLLMSLGFQRLSPGIMTLLFIAFSILMGMSLSFVLLIYTGSSVFKTYAVTSAMFGIMAVLGYTTKTDLTKFGSLLMMAVFGLIIAMVINMFMHSSVMEYIISVAGVLIFTGLTAYDVQKLKKIGAGITGPGQEANVRKMSIMGALTLYLDFINLFLFLLRFLGDRK